MSKENSLTHRLRASMEGVYFLRLKNLPETFQELPITPQKPLKTPRKLPV